MAAARFPFRPSRAPLGRIAWLAGWCALALLPLEGATDPRIVERYRQMLAANPVEGATLDRLWKIAEEDGLTGRLLAEAQQAAGEKGGFREQMVWGLFLRRAGKEADAAAAFRKAAELEPQSPLPHLALARALPVAERPAELEKAIALSAADAPGLTELWQRLGEAWMEAGEPEKAAQAWETLAARSPGNLELRQKLAALYAQKGMNGRALEQYAVLAREGDPAARVAALRATARLRSAAGEYGAALEALGQARALLAPGHWMRGELEDEAILAAREGGLWKELEARWKKEAELAPRDAAPWLSLAALYESEGEGAREREALEKGAALVPGDAAIHLRLARLRLRQDDLEGAAAAYDAAFAARPELGAELAFERAALEVRLGQLEAAERRISAALAASPGDAALAARAVAFYRENRLSAALERQLAADPAALAEYLFSEHRPAEARAALRRLVREGDAPAVRAAAHQKAAELLRQAGETAAAIEELQAAAGLQPRSAPLLIALGDLLLSDAARRDEARQAYERAYAAAATGEERLEADQRLFRALEQAGPVPAGSPGKDEARRSMEALLAASTPGPAPAGQSEALRERIGRMREEAKGSKDPAVLLRLARWLFWSRELPEARSVLDRLVALDPEAPAPRELAVSAALAAGDRDAAVEGLETLARLKPEQRPMFLKQIAQLRFQMAQPEEALSILRELARPGDLAALADLANGQQQADHWSDALATWQEVYRRSKGGRRVEAARSLVRVMQRLEMPKPAAELLLEAHAEASDEADRAALLGELIAHCRGRGMTRWLVDALKAKADSSGSPADALALAQALKATGRAREALEALERASRGQKDRAAAEEMLCRQAEELWDYAAAARHQARRLELLTDAPAPEWERLAQLQESALDYAAAGRTREALVRRFPRDVEALLRSARYAAKWGDAAAALPLLRQARAVDPKNAQAAIRLLRNPAATDEERTAAAGAILAAAPPAGEPPSTVLPPEPEPLGNRLRACFATLTAGPRGGTSLVFRNESGGEGTEREWRLEAIGFLARRTAAPERPAWIARWAKEGGVEAFWALEGANAGPELAAALEKWAAEAPGDRGRAGALIWYGLRFAQWEALGRWLWKPERTPEEHEAFRLLLAEWTALGAPLREALFENATPSEAWSAAEVLAARRRFADAAVLGRRLYDAMPAPRGAVGGTLAGWLLNAGETSAALELYRQAAAEPGDALDAPVYAAQRAAYLLLPQAQRPAWVAQTLAAARRSPLHAALTQGLLQSLAGKDGPASAAWEHVAAMRPGGVDDTPAVDRAWAFLLAGGVQLQLWNLPEAASVLWTAAVADAAAIRLQGERAAAYAMEIRTRLAAQQFVESAPSRRETLLETFRAEEGHAALQTLAAVLEGQGCRALAAQVLDFSAQAEPDAPLLRVLSASLAAGDRERARAVVERWAARAEADSATTPAALDFLAAEDPPRALALAERLAAAAPADQRVLERLARSHFRAKNWKEGEAVLRRLMALAPGNIAFRIGVADALRAQGRGAEAADLLKAGPRGRAPLEAKLVEVLAAMGEGEEARLVAAGLLNDAAHLPAAAEALARHGRKEDGAALLMAGVEAAAAAQKPRAAFDLQMAALRLLGPGEGPQRRWLGRLRELAGSRPDLLSRYCEWTAKPGWQSVQERGKNLRELWEDGAGPPVAGGWLVAAMLESSPEEAAAALARLLTRPETPEPLLTWLEERCRAANRPDLSLEITAVLRRRTGDEPKALLRHARALHALGRDDEASALLEAAQARAVLSPSLYGDLALAAQEIGNRALARPLFENAVAADPAALRPEAYFGYARLLEEERDFTGAKRLLIRVYRNPANRDPQPVADYLRRSGRSAREEMRDLELPPSLAEEVEKRAGEGAKEAPAGQ